jgi:hypothetical protein
MMAPLSVSLTDDTQIGRGQATDGVDKSSMEESYRKIWERIASGVQLHVSADAFQRWFAAIELVHADDVALTLQVPNTIFQLWIESNYLAGGARRGR